MPAGTLAAGEAVLLVDRKDREYLRLLRPGRSIHIRSARFAVDDLIGLAEGTAVRADGTGEAFLLLRPTYAGLIPNLPRQAQVIYPKDVGSILLWGDIHPGARVVEIGVGPGALTMALLRAIGPAGTLTSYEIREDHCAMARENVARFHGEAPQWRLCHADASAGLAEREVDRIVVDMPEPWTVLDAAAEALRPGGVLVGYVPTVLQVKELVDAARGAGFGRVEVMETLMRFWHVQGRSIRPEHRMVAHTGFVVVARRLAGEAAVQAAPGTLRGVSDG